jgi:hypothetical protein
MVECTVNDKVNELARELELSRNKNKNATRAYAAVMRPKLRAPSDLPAWAALEAPDAWEQDLWRTAESLMNSAGSCTTT